MPESSKMAGTRGEKTQKHSVEPRADPMSTENAPTVASHKWQFIRSSYTYKAIALIVLAALYSPVSQLTLSPVYGSVGAGVYHDKGLIATVLLTIFARGELMNYLPVSIGKAIPTVAFWIPTVQFILFRYSSYLGNPNGPFWTECSTYYPLVALSLYVAGQYLDIAGIGSFRVFEMDFSVHYGSFLIFALARRAVKGFVIRNVGSNIVMTRLGLQMTIGMLYTLLIPSSLFWLSIPSTAFTMSRNVHNPLARTTKVLEDTLATYNYTLLERRESLTGYISVLENNKLKFRAMRCDHSLLGGEWILLPRNGKAPPQVKEPIYAIFAMLEAVRLVKTDDDTNELGKRALNIGLGVGTAPSALIAHGVNTTILELDPAVYDFALKYFDLPSNHSAKIGDAVEIVAETRRSYAYPIYDYIIHDVFTGGAEPVELFTSEFLSDLKALLQPDGAIAINYAGDLAMPAASLIYRTILSVFPSCRVYREVKAPLQKTKATDFTNMVFFCTKSTAPVVFRKPTESDFLGSGARQQFLPPKHEILPASFQTEGGILMEGQTKELEKWQVRSAIGHWKLMRTVIPAAVWENW